MVSLMRLNGGLLLVLATAVISGFSIFANKFGVSGINSDVYVFARSLLVSAFLVGIILLRGQWGKLERLSLPQWRDLALVGLVGGSVPFLLFFKGLQLSSSASASFLQKTMFLYVGVLGFVFLKEKANRWFLGAAVLLLVGNFLLLGGMPGELNAGNLLVLLATLFWAAENVFSKHLLKGMDAGVLGFGRMFFGAVFVLAYLGATGGLGLVGGLSVGAWEWVLVSSVLLLAYVWTWYHGLKHVSATTATSVLLLGSPITTLLNFAYSGSVVSAGQVAGILLLVAGTVGVAWVFEKRVYATSTAYP